MVYYLVNRYYTNSIGYQNLNWLISSWFEPRNAILIIGPPVHGRTSMVPIHSGVSCISMSKCTIVLLR